MEERCWTPRLIPTERSGIFPPTAAIRTSGADSDERGLHWPQDAAGRHGSAEDVDAAMADHQLDLSGWTGRGHAQGAGELCSCRVAMPLPFK